MPGRKELTPTQQAAEELILLRQDGYHLEPLHGHGEMACSVYWGKELVTNVRFNGDSLVHIYNEVPTSRASIHKQAHIPRLHDKYPR